MDNNYSERIVCLGHVCVTFVQEARNTVNDVTWQTTETYFPTFNQNELGRQGCYPEKHTYTYSFTDNVINIALY